jgi:hypothetical protein
MSMADKYFPIYLKCKECDKTFLRTNVRQIYCSHACGNRVYGRKRQQLYMKWKSSKIAAE